MAISIHPSRSCLLPFYTIPIFPLFKSKDFSFTCIYMYLWLMLVKLVMSGITCNVHVGNAGIAGNVGSYKTGIAGNASNVCWHSSVGLQVMMGLLVICYIM